MVDPIRTPRRSQITALIVPLVHCSSGEMPEALEIIATGKTTRWRCLRRQDTIILARTFHRPSKKVELHTNLHTMQKSKPLGKKPRAIQLLFRIWARMLMLYCFSSALYFFTELCLYMFLVSGFYIRWLNLSRSIPQMARISLITNSENSDFCKHGFRQRIRWCNL